MPLAASRLTLARELRGMTKRDLARRVDVTEAAIAQWERGRRDPEIVNLVRLTSALRMMVSSQARGCAPSKRSIP